MSENLGDIFQQSLPNNPVNIGVEKNRLFNNFCQSIKITVARESLFEKENQQNGIYRKEQQFPEKKHVIGEICTRILKRLV